MPRFSTDYSIKEMVDGLLLDLKNNDANNVSVGSNEAVGFMANRIFSMGETTNELVTQLGRLLDYRSNADVSNLLTQLGDVFPTVALLTDDRKAAAVPHDSAFEEGIAASLVEKEGDVKRRDERSSRAEQAIDNTATVSNPLIGLIRNGSFVRLLSIEERDRDPDNFLRTLNSLKSTPPFCHDPSLLEYIDREIMGARDDDECATALLEICTYITTIGSGGEYVTFNYFSEHPRNYLDGMPILSSFQIDGSSKNPGLKAASQEAIQRGLTGYCKIRGDNDCYFRAATYSYILNAISAENPRQRAAAFQHLAHLYRTQLLVRGSLFSQKGLAYRAQIEGIIAKLEQAASGAVWQTVSDFQRDMAAGEDDDALIVASRYLVAQVVSDNFDAPISGGLSFRDVISVDDRAQQSHPEWRSDEYIDANIIKRGVCAEGAWVDTGILPFILGARSAVNILTSSRPNQRGGGLIITKGSSARDFPIAVQRLRLPRGVMAESDIQLAFHPGHYDLFLDRDLEQRVIANQRQSRNMTLHCPVAYSMAYREEAEEGDEEMLQRAIAMSLTSASASKSVARPTPATKKLTALATGFIPPGPPIASQTFISKMIALLKSIVTPKKKAHQTLARQAAHYIDSKKIGSDMQKIKSLAQLARHEGATIEEISAHLDPFFEWLMQGVSDESKLTKVTDFRAACDEALTLPSQSAKAALSSVVRDSGSNESTSAPPIGGKLKR